jgi:hypothetical protein
MFKMFKTVWCTLGYFNRSDFKISDSVAYLFKRKPFNPCNISIKIKHVRFVKYCKKSLVDARDIVSG